MQGAGTLLFREAKRHLLPSPLPDDIQQFVAYSKHFKEFSVVEHKADLES